MDSKLTFETNCEAVCKKGHQHLFCLRKLSRFHINKSIMTFFYHAFIELVLLFTRAAWFGTLSLKNKNSLNQIVKWSSRLIGEPTHCTLSFSFSPLAAGLQSLNFVFRICGLCFLPQGGYVVYLLVGLSARLHKNYRMKFHET